MPPTHTLAGTRCAPSRSRSSLGSATLWGLLLGGGGPPPLLAQTSPCDPWLTRPSADPQGYRLRGDRWEGIYIREVAGTTLRVVSLTRSVEDFDAAAGRPLIVEWTAPGSLAARLRASSLRQGLYYRMDAARPAGSTSYRWPPNVLAALALRRNDVGVVALASAPIGDATHDLLLPVRIRQRTTASLGARGGASPFARTTNPRPAANGRARPGVPARERVD